MSGKTAIEWTDSTWNPVVGCSQVSPGCAHCYAKTIHDRRHKAFLAGKNVARQYAVPFEKVQLMPERLREPLNRRAPTMYFVNSVSDLFHEDVPDEFLDLVFAVMALAHHHTFQVLTKRPERMRAYLNGAAFSRNVGAAADSMMDGLRGFAKGVANHSTAYRFLWFDNPDKHDDRTYRFRLQDEPLPNVWLGTSVENQRFLLDRASRLVSTPAAVRFISAEPLLGRFNALDLDILLAGGAIHWVIVGGESGKGARPMDEGWAREVRDLCKRHRVAFFLKQLGGETKKRGHEDALLDGVRHVEFPRVAT